MTRLQTLYEILDVRPAAGPEEIRAAYIRLMKAHHPDSQRSDGTSGSSDHVAAINRCYAVLRDPVKRREYDSTLARADAASSAANIATRQPANRGAPTIAAFGALGAALALIWWIVADTSRNDPGPGLLTSIPRAATGSTFERTVPLPSQSAIRARVRQAMALPVRDAISASQECYRKARQDKDAVAIQTCIIFDEAALYSPALARRGLSSTAYFREEVVSFRQRGGLSVYTLEPDRRLNTLRRLAYSMVVFEIRSRSSEPADAANP